MMLMDEKLATVQRVGLFLSLVILGVGMAACGPRRLNVMSTPDQTLMAIGIPPIVPTRFSRRIMMRRCIANAAARRCRL